MSDIAARSPIVSIPRRANRSPETGPIPQSLRTGSAWRKSSCLLGGMTMTPSGLAIPEAIFAICLPLPTPTEAANPTPSKMRARISCAKASASAAVAPTRSTGSPNASSNDNISMTGTASRTMPKILLLTTRYTEPRGGSTTADAPTRRRAWCIGMAECAPNRRAA
ncbi:Uncharacterised protein [Mycobacteroides abscessus subsp. abscessus]|nr:Uncharacterised protein [Mycobacteroides abscessus subsp. abscessus]